MLISAYITNALAQHAQGQSALYDELVQQISSTTFSIPSSQDAQTKSIRWIRALGQAVSSLSRNCHTLVDAILNMEWSSQGDSWFAHYLRFLRLLVSAHAFYVGPVIRMLARYFLLPDASGRAHQALRSILPLIPTASTGPLISALTDGFPHKREPRRVQTTYLRNVLWCITYAPGIRDQMLHVVVERILQVDVEIQVGVEELEEMEEEEDRKAGESDEDDDKEEEEDEEEHQEDPENDFEANLGIFSLELEGEGTQTPGMGSPVKANASRSNEEDSLKSGSSSDMEADQFTLILEIFDRLILRTFKSRYTQFILFWAASAQPAEFPDIFLGHLISMVTGPIARTDQETSSCPTRFSPDVTRIAAASYVGSFVARAKFMGGDGVQSVAGILLAWASQYVEQCERQSTLPLGPDQTRHAVFYAVIQAVMYIFCFRWRDLRIEALGDQDDETDEDEVGGGSENAIGIMSSWYPVISPLPRVIMSRLNPLKMCSKPVVQQFAHLARKTHLMYCYTIMERNKSLYIPRSSSTLTNSSVHELYSFFPFDPCQLPKTSVWIKDIYNEWEADDDDDDEEESGSGEEESESESDDEGSQDQDGIMGERMEESEEIRGGVGAMSLSPSEGSLLGPGSH
ncbi:MAG: RNA polymerase I-specific transcription initiation factor RRN3 [Piptocephalis tieghemiana]|nr:MAG: RNA polymerase I-specific transcription initiation factor RRN3 [Piptocephalis tieghemiana]